MRPLGSAEASVNPYMVTVGRESRGLSQRMLAEELRVSQGRVSKIEAGLLDVPDDLLDSLARVLDYPRDFFYQEGAPRGVGIAEIFHRKRQNVPKKVLDKVYARMEIRFRHIEALLRATEIAPQIPTLNVEDYNDSPEDIARLVRAMWNLPRGPIRDLTEMLEDQGVVIVSFDFETKKIDAISRWLPGLPPVIFINQDSPKDRLRLSLAHELGHLIMHAIPNPDIEDQANRFAAELLLPEYDVRSDLTDLTIAKLAILKRYWKASMNAILKRAEDIRAIGAGRARSLWMQMAHAGYRTREPVELDVQGERPSLLRELVDTHLHDLGYSPADIRKLMLLNDGELYSFYLRDHSKPPLRAVRAL